MDLLYIAHEDEAKFLFDEKIPTSLIARSYWNTIKNALTPRGDQPSDEIGLALRRLNECASDLSSAMLASKADKQLSAASEEVEVRELLRRLHNQRA